MRVKRRIKVDNFQCQWFYEDRYQLVICQGHMKRRQQIQRECICVTFVNKWVGVWSGCVFTYMKIPFDISVYINIWFRYLRHSTVTSLKNKWLNHHECINLKLLVKTGFTLWIYYALKYFHSPFRLQPSAHFYIFSWIWKWNVVVHLQRGFYKS